MVGGGVWALLQWLTYKLMAMATVWRRGREVEEAPSGPTSPQRVEVRSCRPITTDEKSHQSPISITSRRYDAHRMRA